MSESALVLRCPICQSDIGWTAPQAIACGGCQTTFAEVGGIPWFYRDGARILDDWKAQAGFYLQEIERQAQECGAGLTNNRSLETTRQRLTHLNKSHIEHGKYVRRLLEPLALTQIPPMARESGVKLPLSQGLLSYEGNVFRDWCWGDDENRLTLELYLDVLPKELNPARMLAPGAGACRLPVDLHMALGVKNSLLCDINPLLLLAAKQILSGLQVQLVEFPLAPVSLQATAVTRALRAPYSSPPQGIHLMFADAMNLPVASRSFDFVLTHWFLDIVPQDLRMMLARINRTLEVGGIFANGGSCAFSGNVERRYSHEEFLAALSEVGFEVLKTEARDLPYLRCPDSSHSRVEKVFCTAARKVRDVEQPKEYRYLPEWITNSSIPIPQQPAIQGSLVQHKVFLDILIHVDGKRTMQQVAALFARTYGIKPDEALPSVRAFFTREYENGLFQRM